MAKWVLSLLVVLATLHSLSAQGQLKPEHFPEGYDHDRWKTSRGDLMFYRDAYTSSFDSNDDDNGDRVPDLWGIPHWVSYEIRRKDRIIKYENNRPSPWLSDKKLEGWAPTDKTYGVQGTKKLKVTKDEYRFARGHMCPKESAERISKEAGWNTHTIFNAVPQLQWQNSTVWLRLEEKCNGWADHYGKIWVTSGPVFFERKPSMWLGQTNEVQAAIPDALFKIVVKEEEGKPVVLAFLMPNIQPKIETKLKPDALVAILSGWLTSVDQIEELTGLNFFSELDEKTQQDLEAKPAEAIWRAR